MNNTASKMPVSDPWETSQSWKPRAFVFSNAVAFILIGSWIWPATRSMWDQLDLTFVRLFGVSMELGYVWQVFWAFLNIRAMDALPGILIIVVLFYSIWGLKRPLQVRGAGLIATLALIVATIPFLNSAIVHGWLEYHRDSPSLAVEGFVRLRDLVPGLPFKDQSQFSIPGDHAFILCCFMIFFWYFGKRGLVVTSTALALFFVLPRMISGAHWITDTIVGGLAPALIATSIMYATPLHRLIMQGLDPVIRNVVKRMPEAMLVPDHGLEPHAKSGVFR